MPDGENESERTGIECPSIFVRSVHPAGMRSNSATEPSCAPTAINVPSAFVATLIANDAHASTTPTFSPLSRDHTFTLPDWLVESRCAPSAEYVRAHVSIGPQSMARTSFFDAASYLRGGGGARFW